MALVPYLWQIGNMLYLFNLVPLHIVKFTKVLELIVKNQMAKRCRDNCEVVGPWIWIFWSWCIQYNVLNGHM